ncbi:MAG: alpha/beta fold hydrolase [Leptolyngbya sp. SIOISBB]|nr:alpha/beta fold hydrolase [Leptolyngbya sp. SIOISBB]
MATYSFPFSGFWSAASFAVAAIALTAPPGRTAEEVVLDLGPFSRSLAVDSIEAYVQDGTVDDDLAYYLGRLRPEQQDAVTTVLTTGRETDVFNLSQWYYAPMGERTLLFLGDLFPTAARLNGQKAIRAALIEAAAEDGQTSLLGILRHYPTEIMRVDMGLMLRSARQVIDEADRTLATVEVAKQISEAAAAQNPLPDLSALPDPTQLGPYPVRQIELVLQDDTREDPILGGPRHYPATVFVPADLTAIAGTLPVIVMSHGLGDSRSSFFDMASHVASYGFAVALPDHIGSNRDYREALFAGLTSDYFAAADFLDRPLDVSFLLDELERANLTQYQGKLNFDQVAIAGHSFGGYTALAVGGATIDFARLVERCDPNANIVLDGAMVLECRALELLNQPEVVQQIGEAGVGDERVQLVMAFSPVSNLFGERGISQIQQPVMIEGGAFDILAPVVPQQTLAFSWLQSPEKYFYLAENTSHSPGFTGLTSRLFNLEQQFEQGIEEGLGVSRDLNKALLVAFGNVYLKGMSEFEPFLSAAYVETTSEEPFNFHLVRDVPATLIESLK